ncbi:PDR/VanB family oxidoreductase [Noviherbaspirillum saxi]|uniref:Oxidoreductase n=1 Tax=Noviherbaspirillum saxi TaxID=2320863 RepID=A0A3A3FIR3_9BURK|nr:PDR/VanB family oxidoreductase [Noviherbaspirillum saxi]RJF92278.1 oxidoreductase [Noviherbaspirillum saxi]
MSETKVETIDVKVVRKTKEADGIVSFKLQAANGKPLASFSAGSHIDVHVPGGIVRQYSLCNDPHDSSHYQIAVLRDPASRGGSLGMHEQVNQGDVIKISQPKNQFPLVPAERSLLLAGGIGITPILCMAERLTRIGARFKMHYCSRSAERTAFVDRIKASAFASHAQFHFDDAGSEQKLDLPAILKKAGKETHIYVCGPTGFIEHVVATAKELGVGEEFVHFEYFGAKQADTTGDTAFEVKIASTGACYQIPAGKTVVAILEEQGISIPISCEQGVCGTCITRILDGVPDHRDMYFMDNEKAQNDQFTPCCSRAKSTSLTLDL